MTVTLQLHHIYRMADGTRQLVVGLSRGQVTHLLEQPDGGFKPGTEQTTPTQGFDAAAQEDLGEVDATKLF